MTKLDRKTAERILEQKELSADNLKFLKKVLWQDSIFVMAHDCFLKPHFLDHFVKGTRKFKSGDSTVELICERAFLKLLKRPRVVLQID